MFALTDFCALYTLDVLGWPVPLVAARDHRLRRAARRGQWRADRLSAPARVHHDADHADHLPLGIRPSDPATIPTISPPPFRTFRPGISSAAATCSAYPASRSSISAVAIFGHIFLTRLRPGWHVTAIGGSRRSAYNSGIAVRRTIALCYVACGALTARRRAVLRRAARHGRRRHRRRTGSDRADRDGARRHHAWRRPGLGHEIGWSAR